MADRVYVPPPAAPAPRYRPVLATLTAIFGVWLGACAVLFWSL